MSDAAVILGDPGTRTNYRTAAMGIAFRTSMIVPAPNIMEAERSGGSRDSNAGGGEVIAGQR